MKTREQLEQCLAELEQALPLLLEHSCASQRLGIFAYEASTIADAAGPEDLQYVRLRIRDLIEKHGLDRSYRTFGNAPPERVAA